VDFLPLQSPWLGHNEQSEAFHFPRIHLDACGTFSFVIGFMNFLFVATSMVFGYLRWANTWEPFHCTMEKTTGVFFSRFELESSIHQEYLDMIKFADLPTNDVSFMVAKPRSINKGIIDRKGKPRAHKRIYVDDCLCCVSDMHMRRLLHALLEAI